MRVISGTARGRKLLEPDGMKIRPSTDKVKESLFNIIQFDIEGRRVLDMFAGSGQLGIEALSRGAASCVFVDESTEAIRLVNANLQRCGLEKAATVVRGDAFSYLEHGGKFDIVFIDPPYDTTHIDRALERIIEFDILKDNGIIICESRVEKEIAAVPEPYRLKKEYSYGRIKLYLIVKESIIE